MVLSNTNNTEFSNVLIFNIIFIVLIIAKMTHWERSNIKANVRLQENTYRYRFQWVETLLKKKVLSLNFRILFNCRQNSQTFHLSLGSSSFASLLRMAMWGSVEPKWRSKPERCALSWPGSWPPAGCHATQSSQGITWTGSALSRHEVMPAEQSRSIEAAALVRILPFYHKPCCQDILKGQFLV